MSATATQRRQPASFEPPVGISPDGADAIAASLTRLLADTFALYVKTKNFHWHMSGPHFRDYHLLLDQQGEQIFNMTDDIAERVRKIGRPTLRSIGQISRLQRIPDSEKADLSAQDMLSELLQDNKAMCASMLEAHELCDQHSDVASASLLENWIDETERRAWFLYETVRRE